MQTFKGFLENSIIREAQQGFKYEENAAAELKKLKFVPQDFKPAGASHSQPDLIITRDNKTAGCELKISAASAGSLILKYDFENRKWGFNELKIDDGEKIFLSSLAKEIDLFKLIEEKWKDVPLKNNKDEKYKSMDTRARYEIDKKNFPDIRGSVPSEKIEDYYQKKKTDYVNVGSHGFYLMGPKNPLKFTGVPRFSAAAKAVFRARVQYKGSGNYQFIFEMNFAISAEKKSPYNIAPTVSESDVNIAVDKIKLPE